MHATQYSTMCVKISSDLIPNFKKSEQFFLFEINSNFNFKRWYIFFHLLAN